MHLNLFDKLHQIIRVFSVTFHIHTFIFNKLRGSLRRQFSTTFYFHFSVRYICLETLPKDPNSGVDSFYILINLDYKDQYFC